MVGDVKGLVAAIGWVAVYASEDLTQLQTEPVAFWAWTEEQGNVTFVGVISVGPELVAAPSPLLLGYAPADADIPGLFGVPLSQLAERQDAERLQDEIRRTAPPDGSSADPCSCCEPCACACAQCATGTHSDCLTSCYAFNDTDEAN